MKLDCLTIVFVDIKDYTTKTNDQSRGANERMLGRFAGLVKPMVRAFKGAVVKGLGDAYLITFKSPTDSLLCAMAVQDLLAERNRGFPEEERFELRFAINAGEVRLERNDVFGEAVNIASRIEAITDAGEIYFSEAVYLMMNKSEVPCEKVGRHRLKGIHESVAVYRIPRLEEVGIYKLPMPEDAAQAKAATASEPLPFGGLALHRVNTHITGMTLETDGSFYLSGALSEIHYTAGAKSGLFGKRALRFRVLAPFYYLALVIASAASIPFQARVYSGLYTRLRKSLRRAGESAAYRRKVFVVALMFAVFLGGVFVGWRQYVLAKQAEQQAQALKVLVQEKEVAVVHAKAQEAAAKKALKKEKSRWHLF